MNKKIIIKKIDENVYNRIIHVAIGPRRLVARKFEKKFKYDEGTLDSDPRSVGCVYYLPDGGYLLWLNRFNNSIYDIDVMVHEVFHLVHAVLSNAGLKLSDDSEEAYAYLAGYFTKEILKAIK